MPGAAGEDDNLIPVTTRFHAQVLRPGGVSREQAIRSAEAQIGELLPQFADWLERELEALIRSIPGGLTEAKIDDPWIEPAFQHSRAVRDVGATMGFELLSFAANNLCDIFEMVHSGVACPIDTVESQLQALLLAKREVDRARLAEGKRRTPSGPAKGS